MKYKTIHADPPWPFADARSRPWAGKGGRRGRDSFFPYEMMSLDEIKALDVKTLAADDSHLYLWIPSSMNRQGVGCEVIEAWGFDIVSEIVWKKKNFGLGKFPRPQHGNDSLDTASVESAVCSKYLVTLQTKTHGNVLGTIHGQQSIPLNSGLRRSWR